MTDAAGPGAADAGLGRRPGPAAKDLSDQAVGAAALTTSFSVVSSSCQSPLGTTRACASVATFNGAALQTMTGTSA